jgi:hypothetical protein
MMLCRMLLQATPGAPVIWYDLAYPALGLLAPIAGAAFILWWVFRE